MVDIGLPDYEMRLAILKQRALELGASVEDSAYELVANSYQTNSRELEGTFYEIDYNRGDGRGTLTKEIVQEKQWVYLLTR